VLLLQQANKQRSSNFQFRNTDDSICNNDKSLCFSPCRIAFPTGTTNNSSLPYGSEQKGIPIQNCISTKVSSNFKNKCTLFNTAACKHSQLKLSN